jgi:hypothetical protein
MRTSQRLSCFAGLLLTSVAACSLVGGSKVGGSKIGGHGGDPPVEVQRHLNYINSNLDQAAAQLKSSDPGAAKAHLDSAKSEFDRLDAKTRAWPQFAVAEKRWNELSQQSGGMATTQQNAARGEQALREAAQHRHSAKIDASRVEELRTAIPHLEMAVEQYQKCIDVLDAAFKADPGLPQKSFEKESGADLLKSCHSGQQDANTQHAARVKQVQEKSAAIVIDVYKKKWPDATGFFQRAQKLVKQADDFAIINANSDILSAVSAYESLASVCKEHVAAVHNEDVSLGKGLTAGAMCEQTAQNLDKARADAKTISPKYDKAYDRVQDKIMASLHGDRARIVKQQGLPSWFDGADLLDAHEWFNAMLRSGFYRYDSSTGCQTYFYFSGNSMQRTKSDPPNCAG